MKLVEAIAQRKSLRAEFARLGQEIALADKSRTYRPEEVTVSADEESVADLLLSLETVGAKLVELDNKIDAANIACGNHARINKVHYLKQEASVLDWVRLFRGVRKERWKDDTKVVDGKVVPGRVKEVTESLVDVPALKAKLADIENQLRQLYINIDVNNYETLIQ